MAPAARHIIACAPRVAAVVTLVAGTLSVWTTVSDAAGPACIVKNQSTLHVYQGAGSKLQTAIDAATPGTTLRVLGHCAGNFTIGKDLKLVGAFVDDRSPNARW